MQAMDEPETTFLTSLFNNVEYPASVNERFLQKITVICHDYEVLFKDHEQKMDQVHGM